jgi:hypothetical protein
MRIALVKDRGARYRSDASYVSRAMSESWNIFHFCLDGEPTKFASQSYYTGQLCPSQESS